MAIIKRSEIHSLAKLGNEGSDSNVSEPTLQYPMLAMDNLVHKLVFRIIDKKGMEAAQAATKSDDTPKLENQMSNTKRIITFAHPNELSVSYNNEWKAGEGYYAGVGSKAKDLESFSGMLNLGSSAVGQTIAGIGRAGLSGIFDEDIGAKQGVAMNPFLGVSYSSPTLRTIDYSFIMTPRNRKEVEHCLGIVEAFKWHSSPSFLDTSSSSISGKAISNIADFIGAKSEVDGVIDKAILKYPDFFIMESFMNAESNEAVPKFGPAVCTNVAVNYTPQNLWRTFESGMPIQMQLNLSFQEMEIITRERLAEGF